MPASSPARTAFRCELERGEHDLPGWGRSWIQQARSEAWARFDAQGFPAMSLEDWRFTSVEAIARVPWRTAGRHTGAADSPVPAVADDEVRLTFLDGRLSSAHSRIFGLPDGVRIGSLAAALEEEHGWARGEWLTSRLGRIAEPDHPFAALTLALFRDGALIRIPDGVAFTRPIHLVHVAGPAPDGARHLRHLVSVGEQAQATVVESWIGPEDVRGLDCAATEIDAAEGAVVEHIKVQDEGTTAFHVAVVAARLGRSAELRSTSIALGAALSRNEIDVRQAGEGASALLDGLYFAGGDQHTDNRTSVDHALPHGTSVQTYKGILGGRAHGVFNGRVIVREGAQKTDSRQTNRNLLLSETALIDTKPELRILADDVKCSHGATIGQLEEDALFYLRARGIDEPTARSLLVWAFAGEIVQRIRFEALRDRVRDRLVSRLPGGAGLGEAP